LLSLNLYAAQKHDWYAEWLLDCIAVIWVV
jgi:hypothetical protein